MNADRRTIRALAWFALAGQVAFISAWLVAGALQPRYSHVKQGISELGAQNAAHPWIVNLGLFVLAASFVALAVALLAVLPRRRASWVAAGLFVLAAVAVVAAGAFRLDCGMTVDDRCVDLWNAGALSWQHDAHLWGDLVGRVSIAATPFAIAWALAPGPASAASLTAGTAGLGFGVLGFVFWDAGNAAGLIQRFELGLGHLWVAILVVGILYVTRAAPKPGALIPVRPRDFLARTWRGEGELILRPLFLGRLVSRRFEARRDAIWISERVWRLDDESRFGHGRSQSRQMYCEFVADDHVRITAGDLPDGVDVWLEEGGIRISTFRMNFPLGPLPLLVRCHDRSYVEPDGTLVSTTDARTLILGIPLARVVFRVRVVDDDPAFAAGETAGTGALAI